MESQIRKGKRHFQTNPDGKGDAEIYGREILELLDSSMELLGKTSTTGFNITYGITASSLSMADNLLGYTRLWDQLGEVCVLIDFSF